MADAIIYLVDNDVEIRQSLQCLLQAPARHILTYDCARDFLADLEEDQLETRPACLILDQTLPDFSGQELLERLRRRQIHIPAIVITGAADTATVLRLMRLGVLDICLQPVDPSALLSLVDQTLAREARRLALHRRVTEARRQLTSLTPRERELFRLVVEGKSNKEMGASLGISPRTVEHHRAHIAAKLGLDRVADMVRLDFLAEAPAHFEGAGAIAFPIPV